MKLETQQQEEPELNLTPLIDVVLLLIIFFMVTSSFVRETELKVELPEASSELPADAASLEIIVNSEGEYFVNGQPLVASQPEVLQRALAKVAGEQRDQVLTIRADARTTHQSVVTVMDVAGRMGFVNITIVTETEGQP
ncbi:MAG TPA: biopolymer transporter ExbD [Gammaproteobacteria bacterium]|nr:biopolymer transporter ExbD [Gammaproteobacteria bacterium]